MRNRLAAAAIALTICTIAAGGTATRAKLEKLAAAIKAEVGTPRAKTVEQCGAMAYGAKPCGGPWRYLIYSRAVSDEKKLRTLVTEYNELEERLNREEGRASDCSFVMEPDVALSDGICVAKRRH